MTTPRTSRSGFTLIELILYVGLSSLMLAGVALLLVQTVTSRARNQVIAEVDEQGSIALAFMTQAVRNAASVTAPTSSTSTALTLATATGTPGPVTFSLSSGTLMATVSSSAPAALTNGRVRVTNLQFFARGATSTPGSVAIRFTLSPVSSSTRRIYQYTQAFAAAATVRYR